MKKLAPPPRRITIPRWGKKALLGVVVAATLVIVGVRLFQRPLTAEQVARSVASAIDRRDSSTLVAHTARPEVEALLLDAKKMDAVLDCCERLVGPDFRTVGELSFEESSSVLTANQKVRSIETGRTATIGIRVGLTDDGNKAVGIVSQLIFGCGLTAGRSPEATPLQGGEKVKRMVEIITEVRGPLEAVGLTGTYSMDRSRDNLRTWDDLEAVNRQMVETFRRREAEDPS